MAGYTDVITDDLHGPLDLEVTSWITFLNLCKFSIPGTDMFHIFLIWYAADFQLRSLRPW